VQFGLDLGCLGSCLDKQLIFMLANTWGAAVWKVVSSCFLSCLWRKMNNRSFEDCKRTLEEIKSLLFNTFYLWTIAVVYPLVNSCRDFLPFSTS
jgi:hypothetical protein